MVKRPRLDHWSFSYALEFQNHFFICRVSDLVIGVSEKSFESAIEDATTKLYHVPNLPYSNKPEGIRICVDTYNRIKQSEISHILL